MEENLQEPAKHVLLAPSHQTGVKLGSHFLLITALTSFLKVLLSALYALLDFMPLQKVICSTDIKIIMSFWFHE